MSKVEKISIKEILEQISLIIREYDIMYFCKNIDIAKEFIENYTRGPIKADDVKNFLIKNEKYIDKEKLILLIAKNYKDNLESMKEEKERLKEKFSNGDTQVFMKMVELQNQYNIQSKSLQRAMNMGKGLDTVLTFYYYDEEEKKYTVEIVDSREVIDGKKINNSKNIKRFDEIDNYFKSEYNGQQLGLEFVLQSILLTDLYSIFKNEQFGIDMRTMILENNILKKGIKTRDELEALRLKGNGEEYTELIDNVDFEDTLPDIKSTLRKYVQYIDIDKLLLISAYRFNEALESGYIDPELYWNIENILEGIVDNLKDSYSICCNLQDKSDGSFEEKEITYSVNDIKACLNKFTSKGYITDKEIEEYKVKVNEQAIRLPEIDLEIVDVIFSKDELEKLSTLSEENLIYVSQKQNWDAKKIIDIIKTTKLCGIETLKTFLETEQISSKELLELYEENIISIADVKAMKDFIDLSDNINFDRLNQYYKEMKKKLGDEEILNKYKNYEALYKEVVLSDISEEEIQEISNTAMEKIIESFNEKEYIEAIKTYYKAGIITLDSVAEWSNENIVTQLFNEEIISLEDVEKLVKKEKLSVSYISQIYDKLIWDSNLSQEQRVNILTTGWVSKEVIENLYRNTLISSKDLEVLVENNIINETEKKDIIDSLSVEMAESIAGGDFLIIDDDVQKIKGDKASQRDKVEPVMKRDKEIIIIDPAIREEFFELLGARKVKSIISENSPFYNYEFYMVLGADGKKHMNTPIIAERYFQDKDTEMAFAKDNATYFFQYGDFLVLRNYLKKDEVVNKKENVVFRSNHTIANGEKKGRWVSSVIGNVVRTLLSSDLKDYKQEEQALIILEKIKSMYSIEQIIKIFKLEEEIDSGEHLYEVVRDAKNVGEGEVDEPR